jgi:SHS2 domain-containing protein
VYRWVDHTGELELEIGAQTAEDLFAEALAALAELLEDDRAGPPQRRRLVVRADDRPALLAAWLDELVFLAETEGLIAERVEELTLGDTGLRALVTARAGEPPHLVKAVTYHRLELAKHQDGWRGRAVLDV